MGLGSAHRPPTTFARSHDDESSNGTVSPFSLINDPDKRHATLGATIHRTDRWSLSPLCGEGVVTLRHPTRSAQITRELSSVIRRFETGGTLHYATHYTLLLRENSSYTTHCYIGTQHGDGGAGTPGRAGRVGLMCWGETEGMRTRDGQQQRAAHEPHTRKGHNQGTS
jgi:hypothetical protein